jgi:thiamine biosynthesis lipoprotein
VTVLAPTAAEADALSTALFLLGPDAARDFTAGRPEIGVVIVEEGPADQSHRVLTFGINPEDFLIG